MLITGHGRYTGTRLVKYKVKARPMSKVKVYSGTKAVKNMPSKEYTGEKILQTGYRLVYKASKNAEPTELVEGRDYSNDNVLWKYTTENDAPLECREDTYLGYITSHRGKVYLCDWSKLCVLDAKTGKVINRDDTYIGWAQRYVFDDDGDFYVTSYLANLNRFDENGKNLCYTSALHDYFISDNYAIKLRIDGDKLIVDFDEGGSITFDKDTLEVISRDKEPNV